MLSRRRLVFVQLPVASLFLIISATFSVFLFPINQVGQSQKIKASSEQLSPVSKRPAVIASVAPANRLTSSDQLAKTSASPNQFEQKVASRQSGDLNSTVKKQKSSQKIIKNPANFVVTSQKPTKSQKTTATKSIGEKRTKTTSQKLVEKTSTQAKKSSAVAKSSSTNRSTNGCDLVYNYDNWSPEIAYAVCQAESGGFSKAINNQDKHQKCRGSYGLFQIACFWDDRQKLLKADHNVKKANQIYKAYGWQPWSAYKNQSYKKFLPKN